MTPSPFVNELVRLQSCLVGCGGLVFPRAVGILSVEVVGGEVSVGLKAPDVAPVHAFVGVAGIKGMAYEACIIAPAGHLDA